MKRPLRFVYAALAPELREVKIGRTVAPTLRVKELARDRCTAVHLLAQVEGDTLEEKRFHRRLGEYRLYGEWFKECPEVMLVVSEMMFVQRFRALVA